MKLYIKEFVKPDYEISFVSRVAGNEYYVIQHIESSHFISKLGRHRHLADFSTYWILEDAISYCQRKKYYFSIK